MQLCQEAKQMLLDDSEERIMPDHLAIDMAQVDHDFDAATMLESLESSSSVAAVAAVSNEPLTEKRGNFALRQNWSNAGIFLCIFYNSCIVLLLIAFIMIK